MDLRQLLEAAVRMAASDLHLSSGLPPMVRVNGDVGPLDPAAPPLSATEVARLVDSALDAHQRAEFAKAAEYDFALGLPGLGRFRANAYRQQRGPGLALRIIPDRIPSLEELGAPDALHQFVERRHGLVLVTGPTGSGKSTTAAAMLDVINRTRPGHIVTIEDPVEYLHAPQRCIVTQREVGTDTGSFPAALRAALREDPNVILVGEMRDLETISLAVTAAETGHLVIATLHTSGAAKSIDRIVNVFPAAEQNLVRTLLAGSLVGVVSQALLRRKDRPGRVAAFEVLVATAAVRSLVRTGKVHQIPSAMQTGAREGMSTFRRSVNQLVAAGIVDASEAVEVVGQFEDEPQAPNAAAGGAPEKPPPRGATAPPMPT